MMPTQDAQCYSKLKFKMDFPEIQDTWLDGYESAQKGGQEETNPFSPGTLGFEHWNEGWWAGFFEEPALFNWTDTALINNVEDIFTRMEASVTQKAIGEEKKHTSLYYRLSARTQSLVSHCIQIVATLATFGICYQLGDLFA
ncbi:MAG: hypothetical protein K2Q14_07470 [Gammaproteobacteria bacterium]|nr:hypothetical protein [Gammaproteobacteria bacterium]